MSLTFQQLNDLRFSALESAKEEWEKTSARLAGYGDRVDTYMRRPLHDWQGGRGRYGSIAHEETQ